MNRLRLALALVVVAAAVLAPASSAFAALNNDIDPGIAQANDRVLTILRTDGTIYIGGDFTAITDANGTVARDHIAAIDAATGLVLPWDPGADATVRALAVSPDGSTVYAGGDFVTFGGQARGHIAAFAADPSSVALTPWQPHVNRAVYTIAPLGSRVLIGGSFTSIGGVRRVRLASLSASTGAVLPWAPNASSEVRAIVPSGDGTRIFVAGFFDHINGVAQNHVAALSASSPSGKPLPWKYHPPFAVVTLARNGPTLFGGGHGSGGHLVAWGAKGGMRWARGLDGNVEGLTIVDGELIAGGHFTHAGFTIGAPHRRHLAAFNPNTGAIDPDWHPSVNMPLGVFSVAGAGQHVYVGGDFTSIGPAAQQGFAQFATTDPADTTAPAVTALPDARVVTGSTLGATSVPVSVTWGAGDVPSDVCRSLLQRSPNGGAFTPMALLLPTSRSATTSLLPGTSYAFALDAFDCEYNSTGFQTGPAVQVSATQGAPVVYSGSWAVKHPSTAFGHSLRQSGAAGASATLSFTGRQVAWVAARAPGDGSAKVYVDGALAATINLHAATAQARKVVFTRRWPMDGAHTIKVVARGTAGHPLVDVDELLVVS
jgi:hypothetical protein